MDYLREQIEKKLIAGVLVDTCKQHGELLFNESICTQDRVIRFTLPCFRESFDYTENTRGTWGTGDAIMFEVNNDVAELNINCVFSTDVIPYNKLDAKNNILSRYKVQLENGKSEYVLQSWKITRDNDDVNSLFSKFELFLKFALVSFVDEFKKAIISNKTETMLEEGTVQYAIHQKYERNKKARELCLAEKGTACIVCGVDFAKAYGPDFAGKIEVHHTVPLSEIKKQHVVDPVRDLVPVCPNCHTALHSKKGGVYTVDELKNLMKK